jgi:4-aminobutyrate aminotransferase
MHLGLVMPGNEAIIAPLENIDFRSRNTDELTNFGLLHVTKGICRVTDGIMAKGEGSYIQYEDGRRFLDFTSGIGVTNLGN